MLMKQRQVTGLEVCCVEVQVDVEYKMVAKLEG